MSERSAVSPLPDADRDTIILVCGTNDQYAMPLAVTLTSLLINLRSSLPVRIFILNANLSAETKQHLTRILMRRRPDVDLTFKSANADILNSYSPNGHVTLDTLLRLLTPELLPADIDKALYLDCDLCVLRDITPLWQLDEARFPVYASIDPIVRVVSSEWGVRTYRERGIPGNSPYFNAGVLLMNLRMWREEQIGKACLDYLDEHQSRFLDQDAINAVLAGRIGLLPMTWNAIVNSLRYYSKWPDDELKRAIAPEVDSLRHAPAICHFAGGIKPWIPGFQSRFLGRWIYYLWRSRWFNLRESFLWTAKWGFMHACVLFKRKVIVPLFGAKPAK
ncbi:MAG TPA: glycosyltransferase family 8 protein [Acidobacteriaceae bacterium]|nr:glycosyltransferase family 8 protein [Acidobacteriaceae bacterium]